MKGAPQKNLVRNMALHLFDEGETIHEHAQPEDFTSSPPDMVTLITDSNNEESVTDKHTFQVGDDLNEKDLLNLIFNTLLTKLSNFR